MVTGWWRSWQQRREAAAATRRAIPDLLWRRTLRRFPFLVAGEGRNEAELRRLTSLFLDRKEFSGVHGLQVTDDMAVAIAAQACLPILHLGLEAYDGFVGIVVYPGQARARREHMDADGVVHTGEEILAGESVDGGPIMLSWRDVRGAGASAATGYNVVVHECAHVLDLTDGAPNGRPWLGPGWSIAQWDETLGSAFEAFCERVDAGETPELDDYAATGIDEFFAVASEALFVQRPLLQREWPAVDALLARYYGLVEGT